MLRLLWAHDGPATASALLDAFPPNERPALTTLLTVLSRLEADGLVSREHRGRASVFAPTHAQDVHFAQEMSQVLHDSVDRGAVLQQFAGGLSAQDLEVLRKAIGD